MTRSPLCYEDTAREAHRRDRPSRRDLDLRRFMSLVVCVATRDYMGNPLDVALFDRATLRA